MATSAYIHIPFCSHKCPFCDFAAFAGVDHLAAEYCDTVISEIEERFKARQREPLQTIFYGGGTPGYIDPALLAAIQNALVRASGLAANPEITLETTPKSITVDKAKAWLDAGINRLSIGIESLDDEELKVIGREHTAEECLAGVDKARQAGFENISCDLMYGLPFQTLNGWKRTLDMLLACRLPHLSAYGLMLSQNSPLLSKYPRDSNVYPDDETYGLMFELLAQRCEDHGLFQYEVSNFAKPGFQSRHNLAYWQNVDYLAFGVSAHRYLDGVRSSNWRSLSRYMKDYLGNETCESIDAETKVQEAIFLGLRRTDGIEVSQFCQDYGMDLLEIHAKSISKLVAGGFLDLSAGRLKLTRKAIPVSNLVLAELI